MMIPEKFNNIAPFPDHQIHEAIQRIIQVKEFEIISSFVFPDRDPTDVKQMLLNTFTSDDFQIRFMHKAVRRVVETSSDGLTFDGFEKLSPDKAYLFIANHRDIVLDSAILQILLRENSLPRSQITFGSNLMMSPFIIDFGKINKMFTVFRGGTRQELLENSRLLSEYIRFTIAEINESAWIAQRNGRTKNGDDKTEEGLLKMLNMSGDKDLIENFEQLNIVPLTISYEYEPCGLSKVNEIYISQHRNYIKQPGEDLKSIIAGFVEHKGRIHMSVGDEAGLLLRKRGPFSCKNDAVRNLAEIIDNQIHQNYMLWERNYIAFDELNNSIEFQHLYTHEDRTRFLSQIDFEISQLDGDRHLLRQIYLEMYANPVKNKKSM
jgi:hypothetical protein